MLASPPIMYPPIEAALRKLKMICPGEIGSFAIADCWDSALFFEHLGGCGYRRRRCESYDSLSLTFIDGACCWHTDPGFGLVACWLIYNENSSGDEPQLITRHGPLNVKEGDLFIFNADQGHAWVSNGACVMVMATIAKQRQGVAA